MIGMCSGFAPAIAELTAICSTVAIPNPGGISHTTSSAFKLVPSISFSTASLVGGQTGRASDQSRSANSRFIFSTASYRSSPSNLKVDSALSDWAAWVSSDVRLAIKSSIASSVWDTQRSSARFL